MQLFYTELYHLLYTQVYQFPLFTKAGYRYMECYSTILHKILVQFVLQKRVQNTSLINLTELKYF